MPCPKCDSPAFTNSWHAAFGVTCVVCGHKGVVRDGVIEWGEMTEVDLIIRRFVDATQRVEEVEMWWARRREWIKTATTAGVCAFSLGVVLALTGAVVDVATLWMGLVVAGASMLGLGRVVVFARMYRDEAFRRFERIKHEFRMTAQGEGEETRSH